MRCTRRTAAHQQAQWRAALPASQNGALNVESEWPSQSERLARMNSVPSGARSIGELYLEAVFFVRPRPLGASKSAQRSDA